MNNTIVSFLLITYITSFYSIQATKEKFSKNRPNMLILFVVNSFPVLYETPVLNQITGMLDLKHDVCIYSIKPSKYFDEVHPDVYKYQLLERTYFKELPSSLFKFDIIFCQFGQLGKIFVKLKKKLGFKAEIVTCFRGYDISRYIAKHPDAYKELFEEGTLFFPVCRFFRDKLIKLGCDNKKIIVIPSTIDLSVFKFKERQLKPNESIKIISVGRLVEKKGMSYTIKAVAKLLQKYSNIKLLIVGDGPLKEELQALIYRLGLKKNIKLCGSLTHKELPKILGKAHIFILASVTASSSNEEGIPNALKEAMATGLPVVSTYHAGIPELIEDGVTGFLVPERNVDLLADKLEYLITHPERWLKMGREGRKKIRYEFDNKRVIKQIEKKLSELVYR